MSRFRIRVRDSTRYPAGWYPDIDTAQRDKVETELRSAVRQAKCESGRLHEPLRFVWYGRPRVEDADCPVCSNPLHRTTKDCPHLTIWCDGVRKHALEVT